MHDLTRRNFLTLFAAGLSCLSGTASSSELRGIFVVKGKGVCEREARAKIKDLASQLMDVIEKEEKVNIGVFERMEYRGKMWSVARGALKKHYKFFD